MNEKATVYFLELPWRKSQAYQPGYSLIIISQL